MAQDKLDILTPNPFETYRDPETGRWVVIKTEKFQEAPEQLKDSGESAKHYLLSVAIA